MMLFFAITATAFFQLGICLFAFYVKQARTA